MPMDPFVYDETVRESGGFEVIAGIDEAGRGPLAGPVVAAAVVLPRHCRIPGVRDSKKIPEREREHLFWEILETALDFGIGIGGVEEIDRLNILEATRHAMRAAVSDLSCRYDLVLIDAVRIPPPPAPQMPIVKGDAKSASIAAASIIAKVVRDKIMLKYHALYPHYGFDRHKGYGTRAHLESLEKYGPSPLHRKSFERVRSLMLPFNDRNGF
ncbi:MAG: ribonuclease HII [Nitrospirota bacterium]